MDVDAEADSRQMSQLEIVRIYFNRLHLKRQRSAFFWKCDTGQPAAVALAKEALNEGITFVLVTLGAAGFVRGAKHVAIDMGEVTPEALPTCLELVGPTGRIRSFIEARKLLLTDAIVLRMQGQVVSTVGEGDDPGQ